MTFLFRLKLIPFFLFLAATTFSLLISLNANSPNIIHIMVDDLGYGDLGCYGQKTIKTPNLDMMAKKGMQLTDYYSGNTVCRPSRLSLWTGKHMGHTPISSNAVSYTHLTLPTKRIV